MNVKKFVSALLIGTLTLTLAGCGGEPVKSSQTTDKTVASVATGTGKDRFKNLEKVELIVGDSAAPGTAVTQFESLVADKVKDITGGQLTLDIFSGGELGGDVDLMRQVKSGDVDAVACQIAPAVAFVPELAVFDLPMVFAKYDGNQIESVLNGRGKFRTTLDTYYEKNNMHLMGFVQNATYRLTTSNVNIPTLASMSGLKIRTMENSNHMAYWKAIGASPTPLAWPEVYFGLQSKLIDAEENSADTVVNAHMSEVQKYLACTNHILYCNQFILNKKKWESLDPADQEALTQAVAEATIEIRGKLADIDKDSKKTLKNQGMEIIEYPKSFFDEVLAQDGVKALYKKIDEETHGLGTILIKELAGK